jgi:transposase
MITVGVDIGKYKHEASVMNDKGKFITPSIKFSNSQDGANHLLQNIRSLQTKYQDNQIRIALEATGHYWINLYDWLSKQKDFKLIVLNPLQSKALRNLNIRGTKTDQVDAQSIAKVVYLEAQQEQPRAKEIKEIQLLNSIPGISDILASAILGEIGSIQRFSSAQKIVAYAGLDTKVVQSGEFEGTRTKLSKRGSPYLRWALYQAAGIARIHDPALKRIFEKKKRQGKHYGICIFAVAHKLTHIIYSILKNQHPYQCHLKEN